jgi:hypothetical protein
MTNTVNTINLRDPDELIWRPIIQAPDPSNYTTEDGVLNEVSFKKAQERYEKYKNVELGYKDVDPEEFAVWPNMVDKIEFQEKLRVAELREQFKDNTAHPCHAADYQTDEYRREIAATTAKILKLSLGGSKNLKLGNRDPKWPEERNKVIISLIKSQLSQLIIVTAMTVQVPDLNEFFT